MRTLWLAITVSSLGSWLLVVAVPAQVFLLTGSPLAAGLGLAVEALPALLVGPWAGVLVDRHDHRRTLICADLGAAVGVALLFMCTRRSHVPLIYLGLLVENVAVAFHRPAARAAMPALVGTGPRLATTNSLTAVSAATLRLAGPPLGTVLLATGGLPLVVGVDVATYLASALLLLRLPPLPASARSAEPATSDTAAADAMPVVMVPADAAARDTATEGAVPADTAAGDTATVGAVSAGAASERAGLRGGVRVLVGTPVLRAMLVSSWLFWTANAALTALLVPFLVRRLHGVPRDLGWLIGALGVGYLVGSLVSRPVLVRAAGRTALVWCYGGVGVCFFGLFHAPSFRWALVLVGLAGVPGAVAGVVTQHLLQASTPGKMIGRIGAVFLAGDAAAAVTGALAGPLLAGVVGLGRALDAFSGLVLAAAVAAGRRGPRARPRR